MSGVVRAAVAQGRISVFPMGVRVSAFQNMLRCRIMKCSYKQLKVYVRKMYFYLGQVRNLLGITPLKQFSVITKTQVERG